VTPAGRTFELVLHPRPEKPSHSGVKANDLNEEDGVLAPLASGLSTSHVSLLVLAIGSGSLFFSHVNDAGFWLVKEYFGVSVVQNLKTWSAMETLLSVTGLVLVLAVGLVV